MTGKTSRPTGADRKIRVSSPTGQRSEDDNLARGGDFGIRIAADGTWSYKGSPIDRKPLVRLFASVLRREADGTYWLVTPAERGRVAVEDAPFTAVELSVSGAGRAQVLGFRTNLGDWVEAGSDHPIRVEHSPDSGEPRPYILIRDALEALILRSVYYELAELAVAREQDGNRVLGLWSHGEFFPLGPAE